jgi:glycosyltransferase involved in cell wall biosynthesis
MTSLRQPDRTRLRVAVVSPFAEAGDTYPQVAELARLLRGRFEVSWTLIGERGLFFDRLVENSLLSGDARRSFAAAGALGNDWLASRAAIRGADVVIAIDFMAFAHACAATRRPVVLWSLDYISDDETRYGRKINRAFLAAIRAGLRSNPFLITQDETRFASFARSMRLPAESLAWHSLPVALPAADVTVAATGWSGKPRVMQIGGINISRGYSDFLVERFRAHGGAFDLTFHGRVYEDMAATLESVRGEVTVSSQMVEPERVPQIVSRCSVGFIGNREGHEQFRLLKKACGQLVEYLRCGKPVISMGPNDLGPFVEAQRVGFHVGTVAEFDAALAAIHADYAGYSRRALDLFRAEYDLATYEVGLCAFLAQTAASRPGRGRQTLRVDPIGAQALPAIGEAP